MWYYFKTIVFTLALLGIVVSCHSQSSYDQMVNFFFEWRDFHAPRMEDGVPDYSKKSMEDRYSQLKQWQQKLQNYDTTGWSISQKVDWYLLWAEMNGLDFAHRVKRPWERDPAFYVWFYAYQTDVPEREGPNIYGSIELPEYQWPLNDSDAAEIADRLSNAPKVFKQAEINLTGNAKDLWITGIRTIEFQTNELNKFADKVKSEHPGLYDAAKKAAKASDKLAVWLKEQSSNKTGLSGTGKDNYTWNLKKVHLIPYSWEEEVMLMERELARAHSSLRLEENRNKNLEPLQRISNEEQYDIRLNEAVNEYMEFLKHEEILPIKDYMDAALRAQIGKFYPSEGLRGFFDEVNYRDPILMRTHGYHWIDLARMRVEPNESKIRRTPLLYNIFDARAEGMATGMEEMMMHAGLMDDRPRGRELVWILLIQRAARALGGLYQHGLEMTFEEATKFASKWTPRGYLPAEGSTIQFEEQFYLQQPAYGTSYLVGKIEIEKLIAEYARQREGKFVLSDFMDDFNKAGLIPISLIYWELTGDKSMLNRALEN